jgi:acyl dehydratase
MTTHRLDKAPSLLPLYLKAALPMVPGISRLPVIGSLVAGGGGTLPDLEFLFHDMTIDADHLAAYNRVCGLPERNEVPVGYPHILAFPMHLALMTDGRFPFPPVGLVHIANRIVQHRPIKVDEKLDIRVYATGLEPHPKGEQFAIASEVRVAGELVWEEQSVNLRREGAGGDSKRDEDRPPFQPPPGAVRWQVLEDTGRRFAAVSGDRNPIHLYAATARLFGFPRPIAHGLWGQARCLGALGDRLPEAFSIDAQFKAPMLLPATVLFTSETEKETIRFGLSDAETGKPHLVGTVEPR